MRWVTKRARDFENARFARVFSSFRSPETAETCPEQQKSLEKILKSKNLDF